MALTASTAGPYFASGSISFSQLRSNFKEATSGEVKASELLRVTDLTNTNPIVPDATENANIATSSNLKTSQFRNTIKYYNLDQGSGDTDDRLDIADADLWNGNLGRTIVKTVTLAGTSTSETENEPAASLDATAVYNVLIVITGSLLGDGGSAGTAGVNGGNGGHALFIDTHSSGTVTVRTSGTSAQVYGGGGGGGFGGSGGTGGTGSQTFSGSHYWANTGCVGNNMPCQYSPNFNSPIPCDRERCNNIRPCGDGVNYTLWQRECWDDYNYTNYYPGGAGGTGTNGALNAGGNGGVGVEVSISGSPVFYGGGGGGQSWSGSPIPSGGNGGGGNGASDNAPSNGESGEMNTGGGGGGGRSITASAARMGGGGSGIVIISYPT